MSEKVARNDLKTKLKVVKRFVNCACDSIKYKNKCPSIVPISKALKILAETKDRETLNKLVVSFVKHYNKAGLEISYALSVLEWICMEIDYGFTNIPSFEYMEKNGFKKDNFELRETQKYFRNLYGDHLRR